MLAAKKVKMSGSEKNKSEQEHKQQTFWWTHTTILVVQNGIHFVVVQNNGKEMYKSLLHVQFVFLLIRSTDFVAVFIAVAV